MTITERIGNIVHVKSDYLHERLPAPPSIKIELNSLCAYKCHFCVRAVRENDKIDMDRALFTRIMQEAYARFARTTSGCARRWRRWNTSGAGATCWRTKGPCTSSSMRVFPRT